MRIEITPAEEQAPEREKLTLTKQQARNILWENSEDGFSFVEIEQLDAGQWGIRHFLTIKRNSDGKYFQDVHYIATTEIQNKKPWEYSQPDFKEVLAVEKTIILYEWPKENA